MTQDTKYFLITWAYVAIIIAAGCATINLIGIIEKHIVS